MVSTGQDTVNSMESLILAGNATTDTVTQMVTYSFDLVENSLNNVSMVVLNDMEKLQKYEDAAGNGLNATISVVPYLEKCLMIQFRAGKAQPMMKQGCRFRMSVTG